MPRSWGALELGRQSTGVQSEDQPRAFLDYSPRARRPYGTGGAKCYSTSKTYKRDRTGDTLNSSQLLGINKKHGPSQKTMEDDGAEPQRSCEVKDQNHRCEQEMKSACEQEMKCQQLYL